MALSASEKAIRAVGMVGRSDALLEVARKVQVFRKHMRSVLVLGESGTGKELVARALYHGTGEWRAVNCASYRANPTLLESALFGHVRGAFTGAAKERKGVFEEVRGGTVFLDEIHHLSSDVQVSILRTLQEKKVTRIGSATEHPVNFRLVASAKPDLEALVESGAFRLDLYYRIKGASLLIPPLRERPEDIEPLVQHFTERWCQENRQTKFFLPSTIRHFERYAWPGNVRELENITYELLDLVERDRVVPGDLNERIFPVKSDPNTALGLKAKLAETEKAHIQAVIKRAHSLRDAARRMQISPQTLLRLIRKHGLLGEGEGHEPKRIHPPLQ